VWFNFTDNYHPQGESVFEFLGVRTWDQYVLDEEFHARRPEEECPFKVWIEKGSRRCVACMVQEGPETCFKYR